MSKADDRREAELSVTAELKAVRKELEQLNSHRFIRMHNSFFRLIGFNLARGLAFGLGTVLGASALISFIAWSVSQIEFIPIIGEWATEILKQIEQIQESR
ncbi:hypothetical protein EI983_05820 [Roseovarius faecimaris]|uniref:Uncharacterized protein n=1 Tax=Roseovarius faecimaris TaxID=2494550 RepID=A0A6I6IQN7_9RHOB|nr:DUF5665 domain-containing protein [Roseovarius faecimaris]QGX97817.1 hypothetical protein EI983_05820 [Roseovarius faecimaris]